MGKYDALMNFSVDATKSPTKKPVNTGKYSALMGYSIPETKPTQTEPEKQTYLGRIGDVFTEDIPKSVSDAWKRNLEREKRILAPTELGKLAPKGLLRETLAAPERISRSVLGVAGTVGEVPGVAVEIATKGIDALLGGKPGEWIQKAVEKGVESEAGKKVVKAASEWWNGLDEAAKANYGSLPDALDLIGVKGPKISLKGKLPDLDKVVQQGMSKGVKPTVVGKKTLSRFDKFYKKSKEAVKTIAENKDALKIVDDVGEAVTHPKTAGQFAQAIDQTKKKIYKQYNDMAKAANDPSVNFNANKILSEMKKASADANIMLTPKERSYLKSLMPEIAELHGASPEIIQKRISKYNSLLKKFYSNPDSYSEVQINASIANYLRKDLDEKITSTVGTGYQDLKNKYGALLEIEKEVNHRAIVNARKANKGLLDFTDIFTGGDMAAGIVSMNPALITKGAFGKGLKEIFKALNDPDRAIEKMFKDAYKTVGKTPTLKGIGTVIQPGAVAKGITRGLRDEEETEK